MLNRVFDPAYNSSGIDTVAFKIVGPMQPGAIIANAGPESGVDTYNDSFCHYAYVDSITVEYMDGTSEVINYTDIGTERSEGDGYNL